MVSEDSLSSATVQQIFKAFMKKSSFGNSPEIDLEETDQRKGLPPPLLELGYDKTKEVIELPSPKEIKVDFIDLREAIERRRSIRTYSDEPLTIEELSWLSMVHPRSETSSWKYQYAKDCAFWWRSSSF